MIIKHSATLFSLMFLVSSNSLALELRLTNNTVADNDPAFSPNGNTVVFESNRSGHFEIFTVPATGGAATQITFDSYWNFSPNWHPIDNKIVFSSTRNGYTHLYTIPSNGGVETQLTSGNYDDLNPDYSPNGTKVCFVSNRFSSGWDVCTMPANGGTITRITTQNEAETPDWSHDGNWIAFFSQFPDVMSVWKVPSNGGPETRICYGGPFPTWSPNSTMLAFTDYGGTPIGDHIFTVLAGGGLKTQRTCHPIDLQPNWSPDGQKIVYAQTLSDPQQTDIFVMNLSESPVEPSSLGCLKAIYH